MSSSNSGADIGRNKAMIKSEQRAKDKPVQLVSKEEDEDGESGSGSVTVEAQLDESGFFKSGGSYTEILWQLDVTIEEMLAIQQRYKASQTEMKTKQGYVESETLSADSYDVRVSKDGISEEADEVGPSLSEEEPSKGPGQGPKMGG
ncbi:MAG: hypothetical protein P8N43_00475 [Alphaproteobacteria bacterium]|nr:hypothetical protein [Alphaproteobacteria bacterium]